MRSVCARTALILALGGGAGCYQHARRDKPRPAPSSVAGELVSVPGATFTMGDRNGEMDEYPERQVTVKGFKIEKTEVSNAAYQACVDAKACDPGTHYDEPDVLSMPEYPVVGVSWDDAVRYCKWLGRRLPTEAEWEHAARGTDLRKWPWQGSFDNSRANSNDVNDAYPYTAPADAYPEGASPYGVLNMAGNVAEWCSDYYDPTYYRSAPVNIDPTGPDHGRERVVRGGSYADTQHTMRVSSRRGKIPSEVDTALGFRCARSE
jgi:formylglycine-generating enzyme required for sulfatase activity